MVGPHPGRKEPAPRVRAHGRSGTIGRVRVVANPAHTASQPQALRDKRAWLSRGGILPHTANTHGDGWESEVEGGVVAGAASHSTAWVEGEAVELDGHDGDGHAVMNLFELPLHFRQCLFDCLWVHP